MRARTHLQLLVNLHQCAAPREYLQNVSVVARIVRKVVRRSGMQLVKSVCHQFASQGRGVTAIFIVAESHVILHTWPEWNLVTLDLFFCNFSTANEQKARKVLDQLVAWYRPRRIIKRTVRHRF